MSSVLVSNYIGRKDKTEPPCQGKWPFSSSSTGKGLGYLSMGVLKGRIQCWEASGPARDEFTKHIQPKLAKYLRENCDKLRESDSIINLSLFMVGRSAKQTKPTVMLVSDDKCVRKEAFRLIKEWGVLKDHPGFELGHCPLWAEYENLRQMGGGLGTDTDATGSDNMDLMMAPVEIYSIGGATKPGTRLFSPSNMDATVATAGATFHYQGRYLLLTVNHFLPGEQERAVIPPESNEKEAQDDDDSECEITGLDDEDDGHVGRDDDDYLVDVTSRGTASPKNVDTSSPDDSVIPKMSGLRILSDVPSTDSRPRDPASKPGRLKKIGEVAIASRSLDYCLILLGQLKSVFERLLAQT
jgi:hypothetical protein